jgi:hypothetical protein
MSDAYLHAPLNLREQEIRLVKLEHSNDSEPIKCSLQPYAIDGERPAYVALSYTWGPKERHDDILLNGVLFPVGRSLWSFLHQMRSQRRYITFWIDALSINQSNVPEQNHQVQMMRQIYSSANKVWIWLGEADEVAHSDEAMDYLKTRKSFIADRRRINKLEDPRKAGALLALCERHYWRRIWIVQEIMLAKEATILCGEKKVSWIRLQQLVADLQAISDRGQPIRPRGATRPEVLRVLEKLLDSPATVIVKAKTQWDGTPQPLSKLLQLFPTQQSTDIRDKVYALHGLASDSDTIEIDYSIDPRTLLLDLLYEFCPLHASKVERKKYENDMLQFFKMMNEMLQTLFTEAEIEDHIIAARGHGVSNWKRYRNRRRV